MKAHDWKEVRKRMFTEEQLERIDKDVAEEVARIRRARLAEARKDLGFTQVAIAELMGTSQGNISKMEQQGDLLISTIRRYIESMGGRLELHAVFDDERVELAIGDEDQVA